MRILPVFVLVLVMAAGSRAEVYHSRESALRIAFPGAESVERRELILSAEDAARAEKLAGSALASRLVTAYIGWKGGAPMGCAFIETHRVRSLPETLLLVVAPDGAVGGVHVLAFHEPTEYSPPRKWLDQFTGRALSDKLSLRGDIDGITGASLTAQAITAATRRALAVYRVAVAPGLSQPASPAGPPAGDRSRQME